MFGTEVRSNPEVRMKVYLYEVTTMKIYNNIFILYMSLKNDNVGCKFK